LRLAIVHPEIESFDEYHGGAISRWTAEVVRRAPSGVRVSIVTKPPRRHPYRGVPATLVPVRTSAIDRLPGAAPRAIHWFFAEARHRLRRRPYDVVHVHARPQWVAPLRDAGVRARLLLHHHNDDLGAWTATQAAELFDRVDAVICCSDFLRRRALGEDPERPRVGGPASPAHRAKVRTVHNGVDVARFRPGAARSPAGDVWAVFVGRVIPDKAPHLAVEAVLEGRRRGLPLRLRVVGGHDFGTRERTPYIDALRRLAAADEAAVRLTGYVHHRVLPSLLARHHVYVHPCTWHEPFGMTTVEAMACGLAPVVSRRGGSPEVVGGAGVVYEPAESSRALADALEGLCRDRGRLQDLGREARSRAALEFSWDRIAAEYWDVVRA
jgi:spore coat protein SA